MLIQSQKFCHIQSVEPTVHPEGRNYTFSSRFKIYLKGGKDDIHKCGTTGKQSLEVQEILHPPTEFLQLQKNKAKNYLNSSFSSSSCFKAGCSGYFWQSWQMFIYLTSCSGFAKGGPLWSPQTSYFQAFLPFIPRKKILLPIITHNYL